MRWLHQPVRALADATGLGDVGLGGRVELGLHERLLGRGQRPAEVAEVGAVGVAEGGVDEPGAVVAAHRGVEAGGADVDADAVAEADGGARVGRDVRVGGGEAGLHDRALHHGELDELAGGSRHRDGDGSGPAGVLPGRAGEPLVEGCGVELEGAVALRVHEPVGAGGDPAGDRRPDVVTAGGGGRDGGGGSGGGRLRAGAGERHQRERGDGESTDQEEGASPAPAVTREKTWSIRH